MTLVQPTHRRWTDDSSAIPAPLVERRDLLDRNHKADTIRIIRGPLIDRLGTLPVSYHTGLPVRTDETGVCRERVEVKARVRGRPAHTVTVTSRDRIMAYVPPHRRSKVSSTIPVAAPAEEEKVSRVLKDSIDYIECINLERRVDKWLHFQKEVDSTRNPAFQAKVRRFIAIDGAVVLEAGGLEDVCMEWDATINAKYSSKAIPGPRTMTAGEVGCALSHVALWRKLTDAANGRETSPCMLVLEDDAVLTRKRGNSRFVEALDEAWKKMPDDWGMLYLGFSSRGERSYISEDSKPYSVVPKDACQRPDRQRAFDSHSQVQLYKPEYGYHTHAYVITKAAAQRFLAHLPVQGPIDVWLADNNWFDIPIYCAVIPNEGWKREDGTFEGAVLVSQNRRQGFGSDVVQSSEATSVL